MRDNIESILRDLDERRRILGMPVRVLAERCGVSVATVNRALAGDTSARFSTIANLAKTLGVHLRLGKRAPIAGMLRKEAMQRADELVRMVQATSALEAQAIGADALRTMKEKIAANLLSGSGHKLWAK